MSGERSPSTGTAGESDAAMGLHRRRLITNLVAASGGSAAYFGASLVRNLLLARLLGPPAFGAWTLGLVLLQYGQWSHLSILNAYRLEAARARGARDLDRVDRLTEIAWMASVIPAATFSILAALSTVFLRDAGTRGAVIVLAANLLPYQLYVFANSQVGIREQFTLSARLQVTFAVVSLALTAAVVPRAGLWGAIGAQGIAYLAAVGLQRDHLRLVARPLFDVSLWKQQLGIGLPLAFAGIVYSLFVTIDRTLVAAILGVAVLGQYGLTTLARSSIGLIPGAVSDVIYMRAANSYGESGPRGAASLVMKTDLSLGYPVALATAATIVWAPVAIKAFLPSYQGGIIALQVFLAGLYFAFPQYSGVFLTVSGRVRELAVIYCLGTVVEALTVIGGIRWHGIEGAALGAAVALVFLFLAVNVWGLRQAGLHPAAIARHIAACLAPVPAFAIPTLLGSSTIPLGVGTSGFRLAVGTVGIALVGAIFLARSFDVTRR